MKTAPGEQENNNRLLASKFFAEGFLGTDPRPVEAIVAEDRLVLNKAGVTEVTVADALATAFDAGKAALGAETGLDGGLTAVYHESMGKIPSPFRGEGLFEKGEVEVNGPGNTTLFITALGISLIRSHAFFQGRGSRYRIEPSAAIALFNPR